VLFRSEFIKTYYIDGKELKSIYNNNDVELFYRYIRFTILCTAYVNKYNSKENIISKIYENYDKSFDENEENFNAYTLKYIMENIYCFNLSLIEIYIEIKKDLIYIKDIIYTHYNSFIV
jgi:hypothetical protein